jgi:hypothetical protein
MEAAIIIKKRVAIETLTAELEAEFGANRVAISAYNGEQPHVEITPLWDATKDDDLRIRELVEVHDPAAGEAKEQQKRQQRAATNKSRNLADRIADLDLSEDARDVMSELLKLIRDLKRTVEGAGNPPGGNKS